MNELISVIIPVYNVEKYLRKCFDSVINQTYENLEIIIIDDGSTDDSGKICDEYAEKDNRIIIIHKENAGVSSARNKGIEIAKGDYIGFVDSDDYIESNMYEILYKNLIKYNTDISMCNYYIEKNNKQTFYKHDLQDVLLIDNKEKFFELLISNYYKGFLWNKLFKSEIIKKVRLREDIHMCEDLLLVSQIASICNNFCFDNRCLYNYVMRENSAIWSAVNEKKFSILKAYEEIIKIVEKYNEKIVIQYELEYFKWKNEFIKNYKFELVEDKIRLQQENKKMYRKLMKSKNIKIKDKMIITTRYKFFKLYDCVRKIYHKIK